MHGKRTTAPLPSRSFWKEKNNMPIEWVQDEDRWGLLGADWARVLALCAEDYPFLHFELQRAWWRHRGGGEWPEESKLRILVSTVGNSVRGFAPFFRASGEEVPTYRLIGSHEIMDYLSLLCSAADVSDFCETVCAALQDCPQEEWQILELSNLHPASPVIPAFEKAANARQWKVEQVRLEEAPVIHLPASWEDYLAGLDKKQRHEIRRKIRRAEASEKLELRIATSDNLESDLEEFFLLMGMDPRKETFLTPRMRAQFLSLANAARQAGMLELAFLIVDGQHAAAFFNFHYANRTWVYNSGMNPNFANMSPGWVLLAKLIQRSIDQAQSAFDFMRGNEDYKFHWGGKSEQLIRLLVRRS
jgi:CelD/BcsL family acetyltransferase involved in cellulose biosynthesis